MFNGNFHHPLDNLIKDDRLFMMEAILPFVDDRMKAPLAMYIKIMELQTILNALRDTNYVNSCGLHKDINNQDDILSSLAGCGFPDIPFIDRSESAFSSSRNHCRRSHCSHIRCYCHSHRSRIREG